MTIFGKRASEYVEFCKPFLVLILAVGTARLALSLAGVPVGAAKWISMSAVVWIGILYYAIKVHSTGFGSYKELLPICVLQMVSEQIVVVPSIILAILTGTDNIYTVPDYSFGQPGATWLHAASHLIVGIPIGSLISWLVGCLIMLAAKKLGSSQSAAKV